MAPQPTTAEMAPVGQAAPVVPASASERSVCVRCGRVVYAMESAIAEGKTFHRTCFKCAVCKRALAVNSFVSHRGAFYCPSHRPKDAIGVPINASSNATSASSGAINGTTGANISAISAPSLIRDAPPPPQRRLSAISQALASIGRSVSRSLRNKDSEQEPRPQDTRPQDSQEQQPSTTNNNPTTNEPTNNNTTNNNNATTNTSWLVRSLSKRSGFAAALPSSPVVARSPSTATIAKKRTSIFSKSSDHISQQDTKDTKDAKDAQIIQTNPEPHTSQTTASDPPATNEPTRSPPTDAEPTPPPAIMTPAGPRRPRPPQPPGLESRENLLNSMRQWNSRPNISQNKIADALSTFESKVADTRIPVRDAPARKAAEGIAPTTTTNDASGAVADSAAPNRIQPSAPNGESQSKLRAASTPSLLSASSFTSAAAGLSLATDVIAPSPPSTPQKRPAPGRNPRNLVATSKAPSPGASPNHTTPTLEPDISGKILLLNDLQSKIKTSIRDILLLHDRVKPLAQIQRKACLGDFTNTFRILRESLRQFIELTSSVVIVVDLRRNGIELMKFEKGIISNISVGIAPASTDEFRHVLSSISTNIEHVMRRYAQNEKKLMIKPTPGFREEGTSEPSVVPDENRTALAAGSNPYRSYVMEHIPDAMYYRKHFIGHAHVTYIGLMDKIGPVIITLQKEDVNASSNSGVATASSSHLADVAMPGDPEINGLSCLGTNTVVGSDGLDPHSSSMSAHSKDTEKSYRAILRIRDQPERRELIPPALLKKSILGKVSTRSILQFLHKEINPSKLKVIEDKSIEQRVLTLDELRLCLKYKFGVILVTSGQTTDNEYLNNTAGSPGYEKFLDMLGNRIELRGFKGYNGGLDTSNGRTGSHSIYTRWRRMEIMFHVATLLPFVPGDEQQIDRKRHIGNDIINIVYLDGNAQFDPMSFRSQFTHVFFVVKEEVGIEPVDTTNPSEPSYRIAIVFNSDVPRFGPQFPESSVFTNHAELREFLLCKLVNGENASYKAPKFAKPHQRTHHAIFDDIVNEYYVKVSRKLSSRSTGSTNAGAAATSRANSTGSKAPSPTSNQPGQGHVPQANAGVSDRAHAVGSTDVITSGIDKSDSTDMASSGANTALSSMMPTSVSRPRRRVPPPIINVAASTTTANATSNIVSPDSSAPQIQRATTNASYASFSTNSNNVSAISAYPPSITSDDIGSVGLGGMPPIFHVSSPILEIDFTATPITNNITFSKNLLNVNSSGNVASHVATTTNTTTAGNGTGHNATKSHTQRPVSNTATYLSTEDISLWLLADSTIDLCLPTLTNASVLQPSTTAYATTGSGGSSGSREPRGLASQRQGTAASISHNTVSSKSSSNGSNPHLVAA